MDFDKESSLLLWDFDKVKEIFSTKQVDLSKTKNNQQQFFTILLNQPLEPFALSAIKSSSIVVCADGGANQLLEFLSQTFPESEIAREFQALIEPLEIIVTGDCDSIKTETQKFLQQFNVSIIKNPDQKTTDFEKALSLLHNKIKDRLKRDGPFVNSSLLIFGGFGGRMDHSIGNIHSLYTFYESEDFTTKTLNLTIYLTGQKSLICLLPPGKTILNLKDFPCTDQCGLLPLMRVSSITTSGLCWDLKDSEMEIGGLISSCNKLSDRQVTVETSRAVAWFSELE